ncbi:MAG: DUF1579 family protein [Mojavia pulchra JT2-VF2]|jgi:hypothetical protein|uniref:DUF1579 family protein n=1 Tax=Mojavia pulchra JT2-VF2 TaxID=287848 RepID=A0A951Q269_9NOST|nr:DUF1579 family protein [Mojavia pulchra JT2-VF2]
MQTLVPSIIIVISAINLVVVPSMMAQASPQSSAPINQLEYFQGNWICRGRLLDTSTPSSAPPELELHWTVQRVLKGFWFVGYAQQQPSPVNPSPLTVQEFLGYDTASQTFTRTIFVDNGDRVNLRSNGWQNKVWEWSGTVTTGKQVNPLRQVITQQHPRRFTAVYYSPGSNKQKWIADSEEVCEKRLPTNK